MNRTDFVLAPREQLPPGSRYQLLGRIASGGMASVYVARLRDGDGTRVAVKRAHTHLVGDPLFARMFLAEARLASRIHHPNVVAIRDVEDVEGELLLVMDYVEGGALSDLLFPSRDAAPMGPRIAIRILLDVAAGLDAAHELAEDGEKLGLVHRDVSPQNILVGLDGIARIADFGVAKLRPGSSATLSLGLKGKLGYMAPEYVRHDGFDVRSDVFAFGVVAWEALTGKRLFRGANEVATLKLVLGMVPRNPSAVRPGLPPALDDVVLRALDRLPDARWQTVRAFADALREVAEAEGLVATAEEVGREVASRTEEARAAQQARFARQAEVTATDGSAARRGHEKTPELSYHTASLPRLSVSSVVSVSLPSEPPPPPRPRRDRRARFFLVALASVAMVAAAGIVTTMPSAHGSALRREPAVERVARAQLPAASTAEPTLDEPLAAGSPAEVALSVDDLPVAPRARSAPLRVESRPRSGKRAPKAAPKRDVAAPNPYGPAPKP